MELTWIASSTQVSCVLPVKTQSVASKRHEIMSYDRTCLKTYHPTIMLQTLLHAMRLFSARHNEHPFINASRARSFLLALAWTRSVLKTNMQTHARDAFSGRVACRSEEKTVPKNRCHKLAMNKCFHFELSGTVDDRSGVK